MMAPSGRGHSASSARCSAPASAFGPLLIGFMTDAVGWRGVYALFALLSAGVLLIGTGISACDRKKASRGHPTTGPNPVYAGPDAVYCIAYGHSGPRFFYP